MTAAAMILLTAAAVIVACAIPSIIACLHDREWEAEHTDSLPEPDDGWMALLAVTDEPIFARLMAESVRRDLEEL